MSGSYSQPFEREIVKQRRPPAPVSHFKNPVDEFSSLSRCKRWYTTPIGCGASQFPPELTASGLAVRARFFRLAIRTFRTRSSWELWTTCAKAMKAQGQRAESGVYGRSGLAAFPIKRKRPSVEPPFSSPPQTPRQRRAAHGRFMTTKLQGEKGGRVVLMLGLPRLTHP